jgi:copper oxidase (laccase) domain-containing protein
MFAHVPGAVRTEGRPRPHLDLLAVATAALGDAGIALDSALLPHELCTYSHPELLYSYRRDGDGTGHHLSVIGLGR